MREFKEFNPEVSRESTSRETLYMYDDPELEFLYDVREIPISTVGILDSDTGLSDDVSKVHQEIEIALGDEEFRQKLHDERKRYHDLQAEAQRKLNERMKDGGTKKI